jgi:glycosyltransferase involved in cell wall biosynthesis
MENVKMRIGIDTRIIYKSMTAIGRTTYELVKGLSEIDKENEYFILYRDNPLGFLEGMSNFNRYYSTISRHSPRVQVEIPLFQYKKKIDVFHSTHFVKPLWEPCKSVVTIYDLLYLYYPQYFRRQSIAYYNILIPKVVKRANKVITISQSVKNDLVNLLKCPEDKIDVIMLAFDKKRFNVISDLDLVKRATLKYNIPCKYVLYVGTSKPHKNLERLIKAFSLIVRETEHSLVIGGIKDSQYTTLCQLIKELGIEDRIIFTDEIDETDLPLIYNGAELFVFPSFHEGFGLPPLEAMACGVPVLVSNATSLPEVVGDAAIMFNPYDIEEIAQNMKRILNNKNLQGEMRIKGLERCQEFSWRKTAEKTLNTYKHALYGDIL